jgi:L-2-hydroxycarboxylate dehydrogenase (NAD+)
MGDAPDVRIDPDRLRGFAGRVLRAAGLDGEHAAVTAGGLVEANLRGVDTHGVFRLPQYVEAIRTGQVNPRPRVRVAGRRGATALVDADGGYGFGPSLLAADVAVEIARSHGVAAAGVRNSHHFGAAAIYALRVSNAGMIGLVTTNASPTMGPPGGVRPVVGNNPVACAIPRRAPRPPIVLDMAMSEVAQGKIRVAALEGRAIPPGWAYDARGLPTTDPVEALRAGLLAPIGRHKGYGLAVVSEVLAGVLTGSPFGAEADSHGRRAGGVGHLVMAIDPDHFLDREQFDAGVERLAEEIKAVPRAEGVEAVYLPGEPEWIAFQERRRSGIPLSREVARRLEALADEVGVERPRWA